MDRTGGNMVHEKEYKDLISMMDNTYLSVMESVGDYYTWSNKHVKGVIYSRIDHLLAIVEWFQIYIHVTLNILAPYISDHVILYLDSHDQDKIRRRSKFKFLNNVIEVEGYHAEVTNSWRTHIAGRSMNVL